MILQAEADPWAAEMQGAAGKVDRDKHRSGKGGAGGSPSSSLLSASSSTTTRFWTSAVVAFACCTCALQIQFFRSAHRAATTTTTTTTPTSLSLALLRHDVIQFDPPPDFPAGPTIVHASTPRVHDDETAAAASKPTRKTATNQHDAAPSATHKVNARPLPPHELAATTAATNASDPQFAVPKLSHHAFELLRNYQPAVQVSPLWNCSMSSKEGGSDGDSDKSGAKFVFVHVYKTAGSSMRDFLRWYGKVCGRSVSILFSCSGISFDTLNDTVWRNSHSQRPCKLSYGATSDGREFSGGTFGRALYENSDLVGGHVPLGVHQDLRHRVQYLTFVRDPLDKYVSGKLYSNRHRKWSADDAIARIAYEISHLARKNGRYEKYSSYLLTSAQKAKDLDEDDKVKAMQSNLASMNVVVGIVERMEASYQLLQLVLDGSGELDRAFRLLRENRLVRNKSTLSTSDLVRKLKARDPDFERKARLVLQSEYMVYDFAVRLHEMQHDRLIAQAQGR
jgi:hypothetical protein